MPATGTGRLLPPSAAAGPPRRRPGRESSPSALITPIGPRTCRSITLPSSRIPYSALYPAATSDSFASGSTSSLTPCRLRRCSASVERWMSRTCRTSSWDKGRKTICSSIRFRNSGRKRSGLRKSAGGERRAVPGVEPHLLPDADVPGHHEDGVPRVGGAPLPVGDLPFVEQLEEQANTLSAAFSTSSRRTTAVYGVVRRRPVSCPPSSYPIYPGEAPTKRLMLASSWYSDMSSRMKARSSEKR